MPDIASQSPIFWIAQGFAALAFAVMFWSNFSINRTVSIAGRGVSALFFMTEFLLLGVWSAAGVSALNAVRGFTMAGASSLRSRRAFMAVFLFAHAGLFVFVTGSFASWVLVLPLGGAILSTVAFSMGRVSTIKAIAVSSGVVWITFYAVSGLWVNVAGDSEVGTEASPEVSR